MLDLGQIGNLRGLLLVQPHTRITHGWSDAEVYHLPEMSAYLKIAEVGKVSDLRRETEVLKWLKGKVAVPEVLAFAQANGTEALLMSEIAGTTASDMLSSPEATADRIGDFVREAARAMRQMHAIDIEGCPLDMGLEAKFRRAWKNINEGLLSETDAEFEQEHGGMTTIQIYEELHSARPEDEDLVFTHGDPCMPNIIVGQEGKIAGFIDLDGAGMADRYADIAIFFRSVRRNSRIGIDFESTFCEAYGIEEFDQRKMDFYGKLDDLF